MRIQKIKIDGAADDNKRYTDQEFLRETVHVRFFL